MGGWFEWGCTDLDIKFGQQLKFTTKIGHFATFPPESHFINTDGKIIIIRSLNCPETVDSFHF